MMMSAVFIVLVFISLISILINRTVLLVFCSVLVDLFFSNILSKDPHSLGSCRRDPFVFL